MVKVESRDTLKLLTKRFMKTNKGRNKIAILAIILTAMLFTSLFSGATSLILSKRAMEIKQFMCSSHVMVQELTQEEAKGAYKAILDDNSVARYGEGIFLGGGIDKRLGFSTEVRYVNSPMAESFSCLPSKGKMPTEKNEIALSTLIIDSLGIPRQLGATVTLNFEVAPDEIKTDTFTLCGYWEGDKSVMAQFAWVSKSYAKENQYRVSREEVEEGIYNGCIDYCVYYDNNWKLNSKAEELSKAAGLTKEIEGFQANPAYSMLEEDSFSYSSFACFILIILLAGYLIIYNVFRISIKSDIRTYGLLKNVGTTGKQLKRIVRMQALRLSLIGIPPGLILGYVLGLWMAPALNSEIGTVSVIVTSANPIIFIASALFALLTVYLSSVRACQIVAKVSPIEALRLSESEKTRRKIKRNTSTSWFAMSLQNLMRDWKEGIIVMLSISLCVICLNCVVMLVQGYDFKQYEEIFLNSDFELGQMTGSYRSSNFDGITPETKKILEACPNSEKTGYVYYSDESHNMDPKLRESMELFAQAFKKYWSVNEKKHWKETKETNQTNVHFIGISESIFEKLEWRDKPCSWEDFKSGEFVLVDYPDYYVEEKLSYYKAGDSLLMNYKNGNKKEYKVLGEAIMPYSLDYPFADFIYITIFVPETEFIDRVGNSNAMYGAIDAKKGQEEKVQAYLEDNILSKNSIMNITSIIEMRKSFKSYLDKYYFIGGFIVAILGIIGVLNFFNTSAASILNRKKELALLEVVGMGKAQIKKMLTSEGVLYVAGALTLAMIFLCTCAEKLISNTIGMAFFFKLNLNLWPSILMIPVLIAIAFIIPRYHYKKISSESVVDRIRQV